ncbi:transposase [Olivibacter sitiensis]|uniref:transposase n=1 Tax=Olivibacter sitiensis TaxID=376470 RepID=UPI00041B47D5|nr:transposase [Olivibacter sitiensis]
MADLYKDRYRIPSARASWWDYGANATYFVTICTKDRVPFFGEVVDGFVRLSEIGEFVERSWKEIPNHFPFVILDEFVVMPNHVHGIVVIDKQHGEGTGTVETQDFASLQNRNTGKKTINKFGPQSKNLASIIRGFKIGVTKSARLIHADFAWQPRYHDRILRDQPEHERIVSYIQGNPTNWEQDELY